MERENRVYTIPNLLTFFRLCLIPILVWLYCVEENLLWTAAVLLLSGLTDVADGFISAGNEPSGHAGTHIWRLLRGSNTPRLAAGDLTARQFHMGSKLGEVLDPVADKLTQGAMLLIHLAWQDIPMGVSAALIVGCVAAVFVF